MHDFLRTARTADNQAAPSRSPQWLGMIGFPQTLRQRGAFAIVIVSLISLLGAGSLIHSIDVMGASFENVVKLHHRRTEQVGAMTEAIYATSIAVRAIPIAVTQDDKAELGRAIADSLAQYDRIALDAGLQTAGRIAGSPAAAVLSVQQQTRSLLQNLINLTRDGATDSIPYLIEPLARAQDAWLAALRQFKQQELARAAAALAVAERARAHAQAAVTITTAVLALTLGIGGWLLLRSLMTGLDVVRSHAERIASGDLRASGPHGRRDEIGGLLDHQDRMRTQLTELVSAVQSGSEQMAQLSVQVSGGTRQLGDRTEETAAQVQQAHSSMQMLDRQLRGTVDLARQADAASGTAKHEATLGRDTLNRVQCVVDDVSQAVLQVTDIVQTIEAVALQTKLLSLNAAIEAAHAGRVGSGFAVVAGEVRELAERVTASSHEIGVLVQRAVTLANEARAQASQATAVVDHLARQVDDLGLLSERTATTLTAESSSVAAVGEALRGIDAITQSNAAMAEQTMVAMESMSCQAMELRDLAARFRLDRATGD